MQPSASACQSSVFLRQPLSCASRAAAKADASVKRGLARKSRRMEMRPEGAKSPPRRYGDALKEDATYAITVTASSHCPIERRVPESPLENRPTLLAPRRLPPSLRLAHAQPPSPTGLPRDRNRGQIEDLSSNFSRLTTPGARRPCGFFLRAKV
jgi:hypothetical protein